MKLHRIAASLVLLGCIAVHTPVWGKNVKGSKNIPAPVMKTFHTAYPKAKIQKLDVDTENGVDIYDFEFRDGSVERETDISADGTMLETTLVISLQRVPKTAMEAIRKAADGATFGRIEHIVVTHGTKDGKPFKLETFATRYAAELAKHGHKTEVIVGEDGSVVEAPKW